MAFDHASRARGKRFPAVAFDRPGNDHVDMNWVGDRQRAGMSQ